MDNNELLKDLEFQKQSLEKEKNHLKKRVNVAQLELTQMRYGIQILSDKIENVEKEIKKYGKT